MYNGYIFQFDDGGDVLTFPITPEKLIIKTGSNNEVITLINEGDVNLLKSPSLTEIDFEARFPMRKYAYSREVSDFQTYFDKFRELKEGKKHFTFYVIRETAGGKRTWDTDFDVSLEDLKLEEDADEGDDVLVTFKLRQYKEYGVKTLKTAGSSSSTTSTANQSRPTNKATENQPYTVQRGDTLYAIAKTAYGDGSKWIEIYEANKTAIEEDAKKHGYASSSNGHALWTGLNITIPALKK